MSDYFKKINEIIYEGPDSDNPLSFKYYDENKQVLGKTMKEVLAEWYTFYKSNYLVSNKQKEIYDLDNRLNKRFKKYML